MVSPVKLSLSHASIGGSTQQPPNKFQLNSSAAHPVPLQAHLASFSTYLLFLTASTTLSGPPLTKCAISLPSSLTALTASAATLSPCWLLCHIRIRATCVLPTQNRRKLTEARKRLRGLITKHQRVQIRPVATRALFCEREREEAGRAKSAAPARTSPHCSFSRVSGVVAFLRRLIQQYVIPS